MKSDLQLLRSMSWCVIVLFAVSVGFTSSRAWGQSPLDQTTLGKSQNTSQDLINSLIPGEQKFGKGEKKEQVNASELKSKSTKDSTFGGSLLNVGIVGSEPKLDEQKVRNVASDKPSTVSKPANDKEPNASSQSPGNSKEPSVFTLSDTAALARGLDDAAATSLDGNAENGDRQKKDQSGTTTSSAAEQKPSGSSTDKASASKPDGDR